MRKQFFLIAAILGFALFYQAKPVFALSCAEPKGDQVQQILDNNQNRYPVWFGRATLNEFNKDNGPTADFHIEKTYLTTYDEDLPKDITISIPSMMVTWGPFGNLGGVSPQQHGVGQTNNYFFVYYKDSDTWSYGGPGGCTFITQENWDQLKAGKYKAAQTLQEENKQRDCQNPVSQTDMNICSKEAYDKAQAELDSLYTKASAQFDAKQEDRKQAFEEVQRAWLAYRDLKCNYFLEMYAGGSISSLVYSSCLQQETSQRIKDIPDFFPNGME